MNLSRTILVLTALALSLPSFAVKKVLGKLGQATEATTIYSSMSKRSHAYYRVKQYEYLVVNSARGNWMRVLMCDGRSGFVPAETVAKLPYQVTADVGGRSGDRSGGTLASRSGSAIANYATNFVGTPYVWGGNDPQRGIDCSGFVSRCWKLPRKYDTSTLAEVSQKLSSPTQLQPADIMNTEGGHVILFVKWLDDAKTRALSYEAAPFSKTLSSERDISDLVASGYTPLRYRKIRD